MLSPTRHNPPGCGVCTVHRLGHAMYDAYVIYKIVEQIIFLMYLAILIPLLQAANQRKS